MNLWLLFLLLGAVTLAERLSFILWAERWSMPAWLERSLPYVPAAVLSALVLPGILRVDGVADASLWNPRLVAGVVAGLVAWRSHNVLLTIVLGMAIFWGLSWCSI